MMNKKMMSLNMDESTTIFNNIAVGEKFLFSGSDSEVFVKTSHNTSAKISGITHQGKAVEPATKVRRCELIKAPRFAVIRVPAELALKSTSYAILDCRDMEQVAICEEKSDAEKVVKLLNQKLKITNTPKVLEIDITPIIWEKLSDGEFFTSDPETGVLCIKISKSQYFNTQTLKYDFDLYGDIYKCRFKDVSKYRFVNLDGLYGISKCSENSIHRVCVCTNYNLTKVILNLLNCYG